MPVPQNLPSAGLPAGFLALLPPGISTRRLNRPRLLAPRASSKTALATVLMRVAAPRNDENAAVHPARLTRGRQAAGPDASGARRRRYKPLASARPRSKPAFSERRPPRPGQTLQAQARKPPCLKSNEWNMPDMHLCIFFHASVVFTCPLPFVPSPRSLVPGPWSPVPGPRSLVPGVQPAPLPIP